MTLQPSHPLPCILHLRNTRVSVLFQSSGGQSLTLLSQPSHPLLCTLHLRNTRVSVLPEGEEFLVMLYGFISSRKNHLSFSFRVTTLNPTFSASCT